MQVFLQLYGFCRNTLFALFVIAMMLLAVGWQRESHSHLVIGSVSAFLSVGMLYRYLKFYRLYSSEMFTAYPDLAVSDAASPK